jgi:hypothetical protein
VTPLQIEILMHYACRACDYRDGDFSAPSVREAIDSFRDQGLLRDSGMQRMYEPAEGVQIYIKALCAIPAPVMQWVIPTTPPEQPHA